ncbi:Plasmodium exported protein, unknown function [Plasmodium ovale]|uniref:Uncharacterized protein n=1 Tax=Plasmodium ovale TaxID=36330 RepID=A0A1C3KGH1_PLAOA|nr:Plasmodium exported protein, unknown function [Plasmodium ovale]
MSSLQQCGIIFILYDYLSFFRTVEKLFRTKLGLYSSLDLVNYRLLAKQNVEYAKKLVKTKEKELGNNQKGEKEVPKGKEQRKHVEKKADTAKGKGQGKSAEKKADSSKGKAKEKSSKKENKASTKQKTNKPKNEENKIHQENELKVDQLQNSTDPNDPMNQMNISPDIPREHSFSNKNIKAKLGVTTQKSSPISRKNLWKKITVYSEFPFVISLITTLVVVGFMCSLQFQFVIITNAILVPYIIKRTLVLPMILKYMRK